MPVTDAIHKTDRLEEIKILFLRRPEGVGTREIAQLLRVSQRTARRYVLELSEKGRLPVYREGRVWRLVEGGQISHVVASLLKLAAALPEAIGAHIERTAEAVSQRRLAPGYPLTGSGVSGFSDGAESAWDVSGGAVDVESAWVVSGWVAGVESGSSWSNRSRNLDLRNIGLA